jgi:hypothetical protein
MWIALYPMLNTRKEEGPAKSQLEVEDASAQIALSAFVVYSGHFDSIKNGNASQLQRVAGSLLFNESLSHVPSEEFCIRRSSNFLPVPIVESLVHGI